MKEQNKIWKSIQQWQVKAFALAAILLVTSPIFEAINRFSAVTVPARLTIPIQSLSVAAAAFGLLGFYPKLKEAASGLSIAGIVISIIAGISSLIVVVVALVTGGPESASEIVNQVMPPFIFASIIGLALSFALFAFAVLRTDIFSSTVGWLLLLPAIVLFTPMIISFTVGQGEVPDLAVVIVYSINAVILGVLSYLLSGGEEVELLEGGQRGSVEHS